MPLLNNKRNFLEAFLDSGSEVSRNNDILFYCVNKQHNSKKLSISLNVEQDGHWGRYHCWVCDFKGRNLLSLLKHVKRYDLIKQYCSQLDSNKNILLEHDIFVETSVTLPYKFIPLSVLFLKNKKYEKYFSELQYAANYLIKERALSKRDIISYMIGITTDETYHGYIIIPSFDDTGKLNFFTSRAYQRKKVRYVNCNHDKDKIIFNEINVDWKKPVLLTEGPFDTIKAQVNSTCLLGSSLTEKSALFQKIIEHDTKILLSLDAEKSANKKALNIALLLSEYGIDVKMINIDKQYKDIAEMPEDEWQDTYKTQSVSDSIDKTDVLIKKINSL
ncbi:MAG: hypothetical protein AABY22_22625 [Nanoarchaeota archaeon]